ncbi:major facilitator superfamily domain-containing protein 6 [Procambarus clarkii]|uniref:major facilitator superfamily domain-containing protein 6 n=1 Tax=Procambarus clarkii TaxID=6728 RepID=UPI001E676476|nr:major facilitator superfamily domain-containing protein 6-A-like [Procambarus clarkii]
MWGKLLRDIKVNLLSSDLMPLKFLFFMLYAANTTLYPYLAVHLQSLGFGADKAGVLLAITPLVAIMGPPVAGAVADKLGNFKLFFSGVVTMTGMMSLLLLIIPQVPIPPGVALTLITDHHVSEHPSGPEIHKLANVLPKEETGKYVDAKYLQFIVITNQTGCDFYDEYQTSMDGINHINIGYAAPMATVNITCILKAKNFSLMAVTTQHPLFCPDNVPLVPLSKGAEDLLPEILVDYNTSGLNRTVNGSVAETKEDAWWRSGCEVEVPGLCEPHHDAFIGAENLSFWTYLFARSILNGALNACFALFEGATLSLLREHGGDYGLQRVWGYIGCMVFTPFSGWLIDTMSFDFMHPDFRPAFYLFVGLQGLAGLVALSVDLKFKTPCEQIIKNIWMLMHNPEVIMLFVAMMLSGAFFGYLEAFLFWFLGDLGASRSLMGLTVTMGAASAIPFLIFMSPIINKFGHIIVIASGFIMYAIRFAGYASIYNPVSALYFEALEGITIGLMLSAGMTYANKLCTTENIVSLQALCGTLYYGVGKGLGSVVGGYMYYHLGARKTFRMMTVASLVSAIIFLVFHIYIQQRDRLRELNRSEKEKLLAEEDVIEVIKLKIPKEKKAKDKKLKKLKDGKRGSIQIDSKENGLYELRRVTLIDVETQTDPVQFAASLATPDTDDDDDGAEE